MGKKGFFLLGLLVGIACACVTCAQWPFLGRFSEVKTKVDTLTVFDTICVEKPVFYEKRVVDTMVVTVTEWEVVHDTAFVTLPREEVEYRDTSYRAVVSGFLPRLEELEIYQKERVVTIQTEKVVTVPERKRWGAGVQAGYGITPAGFQPYLGVGVSFTLVRW
jgi:hypothetical protein